MRTVYQCLTLLPISIVCAAAAGETDMASLRIDTAHSRLVVHVPPKGVLSPMLHEHHFVPARWSGTITADANHPEAVRGEIVIEAASLRNEQPQLSASDNAEVERLARGPDGLDAAQYPTIRFTVQGLEVSRRAADGTDETLRGTLSGSLELHGHRRTLTFPVTARWSADTLTVEGKVSFKQSDFGMTPYSRMLGTIAVQDRVTVEFTLVAVRQ